MARLTAPAAVAKSVLSVNICRTSRLLPAPMAARTASSRRRVVARACSMLVKLKEATSKTTQASPTRTNSEVSLPSSGARRQTDMTGWIRLMLIEPVVPQELLARRVRGSFCLHDSNAWLEPRHNCRVRRAKQFALAEALSRGHLWHTQFRVKPNDQTVKVLG